MTLDNGVVRQRIAKLVVHAIRPLVVAMVRGTISEATPFAPAVAFTFRQRLYDMVVRCLAHELRHAWQFNTGWMAENSANLLYKDNAFAIDLSLVPYKQRVEERDANEFVEKYLESLRGGSYGG